MEDISNSRIAQFSRWDPSLRLYALIIFAASVVLTGYKVYFHNQSLQLPLVIWLNDRSLFPHDPFAATLPYYASLIWRVVAWCSRGFGLEPVLLVFFLLERLLLIYAAGNLARAFAPKSRLAAVCAMGFFALNPQPIVGGGTLTMPYFEQTSLAVAFFMLAMASFRNSRPIMWAVWLALGFDCNGMYGAYALTYFGATFLLDSDYRGEWRQWISSLALFAVIASPGIFMGAGAFGKHLADNDLWIAAAHSRIPHHIFPSTWMTHRFIRFGVLILLTVASLRWRKKDSGRLYRHGLIWAGVAVGWLICAVLAEVLRSSSLMILQPARATDLWYCFSAVALLSTSARKSEEAADVRPLLAALFSIYILFWFPTHTWFWWVLGATGIALIWEFAHKRMGELQLAWLPLAVTLGVAVGSLICFGSHAADHGAKRALFWRPAYSIESVCLWAKHHTTQDSVFLINPGCGEFRALSKRPVFVTWKDGSALLWDRPYVSDWVERIRALGFDVIRKDPPRGKVSPQLNDLYDSMTDEAASALSARYGIRYWVVKAKHPSRFHIVYGNRFYKVLELPTK